METSRYNLITMFYLHIEFFGYFLFVILVSDIGLLFIEVIKLLNYKCEVS